MKILPCVLVALAAAVPMTLLADSPDSTKPKSPKRKTIYVSQVPRQLKKDTEYIFITKQYVTGSNIPMVVRSYNGVVTTSSNLRVYSLNDLDRTGGINVGSDLLRVDPSFFAGRR